MGERRAGDEVVLPPATEANSTPEPLELTRQLLPRQRQLRHPPSPSQTDIDMSACSPVLRTLASRAPQLARVPSFLPFSSRASSSSSAPSPSARDALTEPEPAPAPFGLQTQDDRDQPKRRHAFSQPETVRPKLRPIESLSNTRVYVRPLSSPPISLPSSTST